MRSLLTFLLPSLFLQSTDAFTALLQKPITFTPQSRQASLPPKPSFLSAPSRRFHPLFLSWGPEPTWSTAKITNIEAASTNSVSVKVSVPPEVSEEYTIPGQYVQLKESDEGKPLFLAIASPSLKEDDETEFEFLIKRTENNGWIVDALPDKEVLTSQVMGNGFPAKENLEGFKYDFPTQNVLLFATGSGIAPIRAAIESGMLGIGKRGEGGRTGRLYYGCKNLDEMAYKDKFGKWEIDGVEVVPVLSQSDENWMGRCGYVQTALEEDGVPIPRNSGALMCGVKGMTEAIKDILSRSGVFEGRIMTNF